MKKIFALVLALALVMGMAVPAMAAGENYDLTIDNAIPNHTYDAYQIFKGTLSDDGNTLADLDWGIAIYNDADGDGVIEADDGDYDNSAALIAALTSDETPITLTGTSATTTLKAVLEGVSGSGKAAANALSEKLAKAVDPKDSPVLDRVAQIIGEYDAEAGHTYLVKSSGTSTELEDTEGYVIEDLPAGYYLIKDRDGSVDPDTNKGDFYTRYLINMVKTHTISIKGEGVSVEKKINDTLNNTYSDVEDFDINDTAYYMWKGSLPFDLRIYDTYHYKFIDTLPYGIEFTRLEAVYIQDDDGKRVHTFFDLNDDLNTNDTLPAGITQTLTNIYSAPSGDTNVETDKIQHQYVLDFNDLLTLYTHIRPDHEVVVKYSAKVTRNAVTLTPLTNDVYIEYSNNPNGEGEGETVHDHAHAFTYSVQVDKFDAETKYKLRDAKFHLYYTSETTNDAGEAETVNYYAKVVTEEEIALNKDEDPNNDIAINGHKLIDKYLGQIYGWTPNVNEASVLDTDVNGFLEVKGIDAGIYYLKEVEAPDGYNTLNNAVEVEIKPAYGACDGEGANCGGVTVTYKVDGHDQNTNIIEIPNRSGTVLPTTGGVGTTLFYVFGGILVAVAVTLLVTKKRMNAQN